jgi:zinc transport system permease protein
MALGIAFIAFTPGYAPDLMGYLFGSLLFVSWRYVVLVAALDAVVLALVFAFFKEIEGVSFDEEFCEVAGVRVSRVVVLLLASTSLAIVTLIRVVGVILVIALLTIPAAIGRHWTRTLSGMMALAVAVSAVCTTAGLLLSWSLSAQLSLSVPPGPLIVLTAAGLFLASAAARTAGRQLWL